MNRKAFIVVAVVALSLLAWFGWRGVSGPEASSPNESATTKGTASRTDSTGAPALHAAGEPRGTSPKATALDGETPPVAEPMREEEGSLRIEVVSPSGPAKGARVMLYFRDASEARTGPSPWRRAGSGLTDDAGVVMLPARAGHYLASARADGFATARAEVTRPLGQMRTELQLKLGTGAVLEGATVERASRAPLPLVELTLTPKLSGTSYSRASAPEEEHHSTASNERGTFRFEGLAPGEYQLDARAPGHAPKRLRVHVPSSGVSVEMEGAAFIEGFVELPDGKPAAGATVSAFGAEDVVVAEASAGGGFSLDVPPGSYRVSARLGERLGSFTGRVVVGAGMTSKDVRIRLGAASSLAGVVRRKGSGEPVADATVSVSPHGELLMPGTEQRNIALARSGTDGRFEVKELAPGAYDVTIQARGSKKLLRRGITVLEGQRFELLAELDANGRIEGTVVDGEKKPLAGVEVIPQRRWGPMEGALSTVTDAAGGFVLEDVPPETVFVAAQRPGSAVNTRKPVKVESGQTARVELQLSDEGLLQGTVRLTGGRVPPRPVTVFASRVGASHSEGIEVPAAADGTWAIRLGAGKHKLSAWVTDMPFQSDDQVKVVELKAGQTQKVDLEVREARKTIVLTVLEPNGAPSVRATVMGSEAGRSNILVEQLTDESGQATLVVDGLGSDSLHLWATNGGRRGDLHSVPASRTAATLTLAPGGRLTGSVRSAGGRAIEGFKLAVTAVRAEDEDFITRQDLEFTGERFIVEDVFPTRLAITAVLPDGRAGKVEATATSGGTTQVDVVVEAGSGISGRLEDAKTGEPISQAYVDVDGIPSPLTGADGRFRLEDLAPGPHRLTAWSRGHELAEKQLTLSPGKVLDLGDWSLGAQRVEPGRVGLTFGMSGDDVTIRWIVSGAETGGLQVGDVVKTIDGATVLDPGEARRRELGAPGSPVTFAVLRGSQPHTVTLTRAP